MSINNFLWITLYILFVVYNIHKMRELLILDKDRIESYTDIMISIIFVLVPVIGTLFILVPLEENMTQEYKRKKKIKARNIVEKIFFVD